MSFLSSMEIECLYLLIHNKLAVPERLHRIGISDSPQCLFCPGMIISDTVHYFCSCCRTRRIWSLIKTTISKMVYIGYPSDWELINLLFPKNYRETAVTWITGIYVGYVWQLRSDGKEVDFTRFFGYLTFKYKEQKHLLGHIQGLK